jgi:hypothetical protein
MRNAVTNLEGYGYVILTVTLGSGASAAGDEAPAPRA